MFWAKCLSAVVISMACAQAIAKQVAVRVHKQTKVVEIQSSKGRWVPARTVRSDNDQQEEIKAEPVGYIRYYGGPGMDVNRQYIPDGYGYYDDGDGYYGGSYYFGTSSSYWYSNPDSYYLYTPTYTLYYGGSAYSPYRTYAVDPFNYFYYNL